MAYQSILDRLFPNTTPGQAPSSVTHGARLRSGAENVRAVRRMGTVASNALSTAFPSGAPAPGTQTRGIRRPIAERATSMSPISTAVAQPVPQSSAVPAPTTTPAPTRSGPVSRNLALPEKQTAFTNADAERYAGKDQTYTPLSQRLSDLNAGIRAYQDLGEAREADSLGISQERYQQQKDRRQFGKEDAAKLALQRRGIIGEKAVNAPAMRSQEIANEQAMNVQDIYRQLAQTKDPAEVQRLVQTVLALQGKDPVPAYDVARGGQEVVDINGMPTVVNRPDRTFQRFTGELGPDGAQPAAADPTAEARAAIQAGADKAAVNKRLRENGYPEIP